MTSIFLDRTMKLATPDMESIVYEKSRKDAHDAWELQGLIKQLDENHNGNISFKEFLHFMKDEKFRLYFSARGLDIKDTETFFKMLRACNSSSEEVDFTTFVKGCMRMKGVASSIDVQTLHFECRQVHNQ